MQCCSEDRLACLRRSEVDRSRSQNHSGAALAAPGTNGVDGHAGIQTDYSNIAPRIGFAYSVLPQTVLRSGFGISYFPGNYTSNTDLKNVPFLSNFQPNCQSSVAVQIEGNVTGKPGTTGNPQCAAAYASFDQRPSVAFAGEYFEPANP